MEAQAIVTVSSTVVVLTQFVKWSGLPDKLGPLAVIVLSMIGMGFWVWSEVGYFERVKAFEYFAGWVSVATGAAGIFGFTRAATGAVTDLRSPPGPVGAAQNVTEKP